MAIYFVSDDDVLVETKFDEEDRVARATWRYLGLTKDDWLETNLKCSIPDSCGFKLQNTDEGEFTVTGPPISEDADEAAQSIAIENVKRVATALIEQMLRAEKAAIDILTSELWAVLKSPA